MTYIKAATTSAFGIGLIHIRGADMIPLTTLQVVLAMKIGYIYNLKVTKGDVMQLLGATITGSVGKQIFKGVLQIFKIPGPWVPVTSTIAGSVAASITYGFGVACKEYYKTGAKEDISFFVDIFKEYAQKRKYNPSDDK